MACSSVPAFNWDLPGDPDFLLKCITVMHFISVSDSIRWRMMVILQRSESRAQVQDRGASWLPAKDRMASKVSAAVPVSSAQSTTATSAPAAAVAIAIHTTSAISASPSTSQGSILSKEVKLDELSKYFHLPEKAVAKELGICLTSLKKLCRSYGITRWPFRKLKSLERTMRKVQTVK